MKILTIAEMGEMIIRSGKVRVSDPCYEKDIDTHCAGTIKSVKNGKWDCIVIRSDEGDWGMRNAILLAHHVDHPVEYEDSGWDKQEFEVGVDSGQAGIYDLPEYHGGDEEGGEYGDPDSWYDKNCRLTLDTDSQAGILADKTGVVSSTGFGDGGYECFTIRDTYNPKFETIAIKIDFGVIDVEDEDDD